MDSTNNKMIEILIGLVKLEIRVPNDENKSLPVQTTPDQHAAAAFNNITTTTNKSPNVPNSFKTPDLGKQAMFNDISTVLISYDDGKIETDSQNYFARPYEHEMHYNKPKTTYKGPTTLVFDPNADDTSVNEIPASKFFAGSCSYKRTKVNM
jgi:hypothetical protein